jgi:hypothetical protein
MTNVTAAAYRPLPVEDVQRPLADRLKNECLPRTAKHHAEPCFLCGRPLTKRAVVNGLWVHLLTDGTLAPVVGAYVTREMYEAPLDQGWFPVGSECAKRVPETHARHLREVSLVDALLDVTPELRPQAEALYGHGFRPTPAIYVRAGQDVAYRSTDVFQMGGVGDFMIARIEEVAEVEAGFTVRLVSRDFAAGPVADVDCLEEVWAR